MCGLKVTYWSGLTLNIQYEEDGAIGFGIESSGLVVLNKEGGWLKWISLDSIMEFEQY